MGKWRISSCASLQHRMCWVELCLDIKKGVGVWDRGLVAKQSSTKKRAQHTTSSTVQAGNNTQQYDVARTKTARHSAL